MKVLYITFNEPSMLSGGGIGNMQSLRTLCRIASVFYVGPGYDQDEFNSYEITLLGEEIIEIDESVKNRIKNFALHGTLSGQYDSWSSVKKRICLENFDLVYMDETRHSFATKWIKKNKQKLLIKAHNVEYDYFKAHFRAKPTLSRWIHIHTGKKDERNCLKDADRILVLTKNDKDRLKTIYKEPENKFSMLPVCVDKFPNKYLERTKPYILIVGALWFGPNADGTLWFLKNVWKKIEGKIGGSYDLVIAGANPCEEIKNTVKLMRNVHLYSSPKVIAPFYNSAEVFIAPIFYGAGMKVKVAEAMSCGLPIICTSHAAIGYEASNELLIADDAEGFINGVYSVLEMNIEDKKNMRGRIRRDYENNFGLDASERQMRQAIERILTE